MLKSWMLVAAAAMASAGCSKADIADEARPESGIKSVREFTAEIASSRTTLNDAATRMKWTAGDRLGFYSDVTTDLNVASSTYADGDTNFTAEIDTKATKAYAYYPYDAGQNTSYGYTSVNLPIKDAQTQTQAGVLAGQYVPMSAAASLVEGEKTVLSFTPVASLIAFDLYDAENSGESVKSVTFAPTGVKINGNRYVDMTTGSATAASPDGYYTSATVTLATPYAVPAAKSADKTGYIYLAVTPKVYPNGGTFTVTTEKGSYDFVTTKALDLSNVYGVFTVSMNLAAANPPVDYSGTYVVLAKEGESYFALAGTNNNNATRLDAVPVEYNGTDTSITTSEPELVWTVAKQGSGYTFENGGKYLSWTSGNTASVNSNAYNLLISKNANNTYIIKSEADAARILAKYNADNSYFAFYTSGGNNNLYLVPAVYLRLPLIDLQSKSAVLDYNDETVHEIAATVTDATSVDAAAYTTEDGTVESDWLVASYENGKITFMASENTTDEIRTAYIIISATNANGTRKEVVTVVQNVQVQGFVATFNYGTLYSSVTSSREVSEDTVSGVTAKYVKVSGNNPPKYYNNGKNLRIYNKSTMTISAPAGSSIYKIEFTASKWAGVSVDVGTLTSKTWTGDSANVVFTFTATSNIESFEVTYK